MTEEQQFVRKRDGTLMPFDASHVEERIRSLCMDVFPPLTGVKQEKIVKMTLRGAKSGIATEELDELAMDNAASLSIRDPQYGILACRLCISNLHKMTPSKFSECIELQYRHLHPTENTAAPLINDAAYKLVMEHRDFFDNMIVQERDYDSDFFAQKTLEKSYLKRIKGRVCDRPQYMFARVAIAIHADDLVRVKESYDLFSLGFCIHATPTLFNSCTPHQSLSSCFLFPNEEDSIRGLYSTILKLAFCSKGAGGCGISYSGVRASNSYIRGTHGHSKGPIPFLCLVNDTGRAVDQGGGKRKGAIAVYMEPWHANIFEFLDTKTVSGDENLKCRDIFPAMWLPDLFFKRVEEDGNWALFCPNEAPGLPLLWGKQFEEKYQHYESVPGLPRKVIKARYLYKTMISTMIESGLYMCAKDTVNRFSNHQHLGTIQCLNLCTEIAQYSSATEVSVCNLASVALPKFLRPESPTLKGTDRYDHQELYKVTRIATRNLDNVIDVTQLPESGPSQPYLNVPAEIGASQDAQKLREFLSDVVQCPEKYIENVNQARVSSDKHRNVGLGVQGWSDLLMLLRIAFDSAEAAQLNREIFETIYYAALTESVQLAKEKGPHPSYPGSQYEKGIYQFHYYNVTPSPRWDWKLLDEQRQKHGIRNSLLVAPMPTKSTSHILRNIEAFEPPHSMIYKARTLSGEFDIVNKHVVEALRERGLWTKDMRDKILANRGSVQNVAGFPEDLKPVFKTAWEIPARVLINLAADRQPFIDQSQSMNLFLPEADVDQIASMLLFSWRKQLKTLVYYLHIRAASTPLRYKSSSNDSTLGETQDGTEQPGHSTTTATVPLLLAVAASSDDAPVRSTLSLPEEATSTCVDAASKNGRPSPTRSVVVHDVNSSSSLDGDRYRVTTTLDEASNLPSIAAKLNPITPALINEDTCDTPCGESPAVDTKLSLKRKQCDTAKELSLTLAEGNGTCPMMKSIRKQQQQQQEEEAVEDDETTDTCLYDPKDPRKSLKCTTCKGCT